MNFYLLFFTFVLLILHSFFGLFTVSFNLLRFLLVLELITFFITILFILASLIYLDSVGLLLAFFNLTIAGTDSALGLLLIVSFFRKQLSDDISNMFLLKF